MKKILLIAAVLLCVSLLPAQDSLVAWWDFVDGEFDPFAVSAMDASFNMHDGILYGGASWGTGFWDGALSLDGRDGHVGVPSNAVFNLSQELTIYALVQWDGPDVGGLTHTKRVIFSRHDRQTLTDYGYLLYIDATDSKVKFTRYFSGGTEATIQSVTPVTAGMWTEIAVTHNASTQTAKLYIDGTEDASSTPFGTGTISIHSDSIVIGADGLEPAALTAVNRTNFNGLIDELEVYDQALGDPGGDDTSTVSGVDLEPYWPVGWDGEIVAAATDTTENTGTLTAGAPTYFRGAVINNGDTDHSGQFTMQFYLEDDYLFYYTLNALSAGYYNNNSGYAMAMPPGTHWITMYVDDQEVVDEADEMNNEVSYEFTWAGSWHRLTSGQTVNGSVDSVQTWGAYYVIDVPGNATTLDIQVSGTAGDALDLYVSEDSLLTIWGYDTLAYTASGDEEISLDFSSYALPLNGKMYIMVSVVDGGSYSLTATVDTGGTVGTANIRPYAGTWSTPLVVSHSMDAQTSDTQLYADSTLYFSWAIENNGTAGISDTFYTAIYLDDSLISSWWTASLSAGNTVTLQNDIGTLPVGSGMLKLVTDVLDNVTESDETDNLHQAQVQISAAAGADPDLLPYYPDGWSAPLVISHVPGDSAGSGALYAGKTVYIDVLWANLGGTDINTPFSIGLYDDGTLLNSWTCNAINAGYWKGEADWQTTLIAGEHTLSLRIDDQTVIAEANEANNIYTQKVYVSPFEPGQEGIITSVSGGEDARSYGLVSVPFNASPQSMDEILRATFGEKDITQWRAFGYNGSLVEFPNIGNAVPGEAYWVLSRSTKQLKTSVTSLVAVTGPYTGVSIPAGSWKLIATPFTFDVDWTDVLDSTAGSPGLSALWEYNGSWTQSVTGVLKAGKGYAVKNQSGAAITLSMPPMVSNGVAGKAVGSAPTGIALDARCGVYRDANTVLGWAPGAAQGFDGNDQAEPPQIGSYVSVYTDHPEWDVPGRYTVDVLPAGQDGKKWDLTAETDQDEPVVLSWQLPDGGVSGADRLYLLDPASGVFTDMAKTGSYTLPAGDGTTGFSVVAGSEEYTRPYLTGLRSGDSPLMLFGCEPSPFTVRTSVQFGILRDVERVSVVIYDSRGTAMRTLVRDMPGRMDHYRVVWDGTDDNGISLRNGIYHIELSSGTAREVMPVIFTGSGAGSR